MLEPALTRLRDALPTSVADACYRWRFRRLEEARLIQRYAPPDRAVVDVGANRGAVTLLLARQCPHVYAYEPNPRARASLTRRLPPNVTVYPYACSDAPGQVELVEPIWGSGASHAHSSLARTYAGHQVQRTTIEAVRLDDMGHEQHDIGFIKIDVEGHELAAIRGATQLLRTSRPTLWVEVDGYSYEGGLTEGIAAIEALGYQAFFHVAGRRYPAALFSEKVFQPRDAQSGAHLPGYHNNFVFLPT